MPIVPWDILVYTLAPTFSLVAAFLLVTRWRHHARAAIGGDLRARALTLAPYAAVLVLVLAFAALVRPSLNDLASAFAVNYTQEIHDFEGAFVAQLQDAVPDPLFLYFSAVYVFGFAALLFYPPIAYAVIDDLTKPAMLLVAYAINYLVGSTLYLVFAVFGPRNFLVGRVEQPLFDRFPDVMYLTTAVNTNANAFPSLHTSMSVTVLLFAWVTREEYPRWLVIAGILSPSIVIATMALGIHWLTDVIAGIALALFSVGAAHWIVPRLRGEKDADRRPLDPVRL